MYEIQNVVSMAETQLLACLSFLLEVGAISLIDMFDVCNIYSLQDFESIWKEDVLTDLYNYSHIRYYPSSLRIDTPRSLGSRGMYEETEEEEEENEEENGEEDEEEKEMKQEDQEMEEEKGMEEEKEMKQEEVVVAYKDIWGITAWTVFLKRVISHCEENEALKACLMKEIVTPLKDKWEYSDTIMRRFMKLIETYPDSLFLVAVETECDE